MFFKKYFLITFVLTCWILISCSELLALDTVFLDQNHGSYSLGHRLGYLPDTTDKLTIDDILTSEYSSQLIPSQKKTPNFGFTTKAYWFKINIQNNSADTNWILEIAHAGLDNIHVYLFDGNTQLIYEEEGDHFLFNHKKIKNRKFIFPMKLDLQKNYQIYIRAKTTGTLMIPIYLHKTQAFADKDHDEQAALGFFFGIMTIMAIYNLFLYMALRDRTYLLYVLYIFSYILFKASQNGLAYEYLWPGYIWWAEQSFIFFMGSGTILLLLLSRFFLNTRKNLPRIDYVLLALIVIWTIQTILTLFLPFSPMVRINVILTLLTMPIVFLNATFCFFQGYKPARFFALSWFSFLIVIIMNPLRSSGVIPANAFTINSELVAAVVQVILLSFALADRINVLRQEKEQTGLKLEEAHKQLAIHADTLKKEVEARTLELVEKNKILVKINHQLQQQESMLIKHEKLLSISEITASTAHEISTPLLGIVIGFRVIKDYALKLREVYSDISKSKKIQDKKFIMIHDNFEMYYNEVEESLDKIRKQITNMKSFIRLQDNTTDFDINIEIKTTLDIMNFKLLGNVEIKTDLDDTMGRIIGNAAEINQVLFSLINNAMEAISPNKQGVITVKTYVANQHKIIELIDNGTGISPENIPNIFFSRFTTKKNGLGTGLILCKEIIDKHGWKIDVESNPGSGTRFRIIIP